MRRPTRRILLPATLAVAGTWLLIGCVFVPTFDTTIRHRNAAKEVGPRKSGRPIRLHAATRDDVIRRLGQPRLVSPDRTRIAYEWDVANGVWIWPACFMAYRQEGRRALLLTFDEAGVLRTSEVLKANGNWLEPAAFRVHGMPDDMALNVPQTPRPATRATPSTLPPAGEAP